MILGLVSRVSAHVMILYTLMCVCVCIHSHSCVHMCLCQCTQWVKSDVRSPIPFVSTSIGPRLFFYLVLGSELRPSFLHSNAFYSLKHNYPFFLLSPIRMLSHMYTHTYNINFNFFLFIYCVLIQRLTV